VDAADVVAAGAPLAEVGRAVIASPVDDVGGLVRDPDLAHAVVEGLDDRAGRRVKR
jgi:hypothetical protein